MLAFESHKDVFPHWQFGEDGKNSAVEHDSQVREWDSRRGEREPCLQKHTNRKFEEGKRKETAQQNRDI